MEDLVVQAHHQNGGYVEREHRRVEEEGFVVEGALVLLAVGGVVEAGHDGRGDRDAHEPHDTEHEVDAVRVLVSSVLKWLCYGNKSSKFKYYIKFKEKLVNLNIIFLESNTHATQYCFSFEEFYTFFKDSECKHKIQTISELSYNIAFLECTAP